MNVHILAAAVLVSFGGGIFVANLWYSLKDTEREARIAEQNLIIEEQLREKDRELQTMSDSTGLMVEFDTTSVEAEFNAALQKFDFTFVPHDLPADANPGDGVHGDETSSDRPLPDNPCPPCRVERKAICSCHCPDTKKLRELYERQLTIARDCDINDQHRVRLIELYEGLRHELGN